MVRDKIVAYQQKQSMIFGLKHFPFPANHFSLFRKINSGVIALANLKKESEPG